MNDEQKQVLRRSGNMVEKRIAEIGTIANWMSREMSDPSWGVKTCHAALLLLQKNVQFDRVVKEIDEKRSEYFKKRREKRAKKEQKMLTHNKIEEGNQEDMFNNERGGG